MTRDNAGTTELRAEASVDALRIENERLRDENADLRASALWWSRLYEASINRANELERPAGEVVNNQRDPRRCDKLVR